MVWLFNRKELLITWDLTELNQTRNILRDNGIPYSVRTVNQCREFRGASGTRAGSGTFGLRRDAMYLYYIYVKRSDYEKARSLIGR